MKNKHDKFWELSAGKIYGENTTDDNKELEKLLSNKELKEDFRDAEKIHANLSNLKSLSEISSSGSWHRISDYFQKRTVRLFLSVSKYAAVITIAFIVGNLVSTKWFSGNENQQFAEVRVPLGQMSAITMYDGTEVWLNSGTTLKYAKDFGNKNRNIELNGEAFFKVSHSEMPFKVSLKNCEIEVLGTSFNAVSFEDDEYSQITLVEGEVQLNTLNGELITRLEPSRQIVLSNDLKDIKLRSVNTDFYKSWAKGRIVFHEEKLADIAERLERWYNVDIQLEGAETGNIRFSGTILKNKPFDQIVKAFELLLPITIDYQNNIEKKDVIKISNK